MLRNTQVTDINSVKVITVVNNARDKAEAERGIAEVLDNARLRATSHPLASLLAAEFDRKQAKPSENARVIPASY